MKRVTIRDIAAYTGISVATVNRAVSGNGYVSDEKRRIIQDAAELLGYQNGKSALGIAPSIRLIAYFSYSNSHPLFARLSEEIARSALVAGYYVINVYVDTQTDAQDIVKQIQVLLRHGVQGIIFNAIADEIDLMSIQDYLQSLEIPLVMIERIAEIYNTNKVRINARESMHLAVKYLWENNHREIKFFHPDRSTIVERDRMEGFFKAMESYSMRSGAELIATAHYLPEQGYQAMERYLAHHPLPKAIIAADSILAGILQYFYTIGVRVPDDVSLIGLDDTFSSFSAPAVTTIAFPVKQMCDLAISMIQQQNTHGKRNNAAQEILLSPYLVERHSVKRL